jgi:hypothetical protein
VLALLNTLTGKNQFGHIHSVNENAIDRSFEVAGGLIDEVEEAVVNAAFRDCVDTHKDSITRMRFAGLINAIEQLSAQAKGRNGFGFGRARHSV